MNRTCSAEFGDIFLFIIFKRDVELLFWSVVVNPFCVFLAWALLSPRLRSLGGKKISSRIDEVVLGIKFVCLFCFFFCFFFFPCTETSSPDTLRLRVHPLSCVYAVLSPDVASVLPGVASVLASLSQCTCICSVTGTVSFVSAFSLATTVLEKCLWNEPERCNHGLLNIQESKLI